MHVLVTGGAGYIGSVITRLLLEHGHAVRILDDLSTGHKESLPPTVDFILGSLLDPHALESALGGIDAVIHCAGKSLVSESVSHPEKYRTNNVVGSSLLIHHMLLQGVRRIVFSSSAAVYQGDSHAALSESAVERPSNPYGQSKLEVDRMLQSSGLLGASLRYFNVAGALWHNEQWVGERHEPESHLIPNLLIATKDQPLRIFGTDWQTRDGTCIRDYVDVVDLARAHVAALEIDGFQVCNLGTGTGTSVLEVIRAAEEALERQVPYLLSARREGDPEVLVASYARAKELLQWQPQRSIVEMIASAESFRRQPW